MGGARHLTMVVHPVRISRMVSRKRIFTVVGLLMVLLISALLVFLRPLFGIPSALNAVRWLVWSHSYKSAILSQPDSPNGYLKHVEWDYWGWSGQETEVYVVFDPTDSLTEAARSGQPGKYSGIPCEFFRVRRLESHWYTVQFYTDGDWQAKC
jgi:hypothetical protein